MNSHQTEITASQPTSSTGSKSHSAKPARLYSRYGRYRFLGSLFRSKQRVVPQSPSQARLPGRHEVSIAVIDTHTHPLCITGYLIIRCCISWRVHRQLLTGTYLGPCSENRQLDDARTLKMGRHNMRVPR